MIVAIAGGPGTGKTYLARSLSIVSRARILHTDDVIAEVEHLPKHERWSAASLLVAERLIAATGDLIVEGVRSIHALRKAMDLTPGSPWRPCDRLIVLRGRRPEAGPPGDGHEALAKSIDTILAGIERRLLARDVVIEYAGTAVAPTPTGELLRAARRSWKVMA